MHTNEQLIHKFYTAFQNNDPLTMKQCYHPDIQFRDPAFGLLKGEQANMMWKMLLERAKGNIKIAYTDVKADEIYGIAKWVAQYTFSQTNRKVVNYIAAEFQFKDGLIYKHTDNFNVWKWSQQALGWKGFLLGWTGFFQKKIQEKALYSLQKYSEK
ncbi:nuclear transport factor 2 family protein [Flavobacterium sp. RSSA_27]|uniref:nuclear transport factor 2 family protein n=1 Tax=Flavobacterium sp. RSSA_27 TaxID=3447667 RepID=UPI003F40DC31